MIDSLYLLGSSYYPEQWPRHEWAVDFEKMRRLGFNVVRMGEFAWSSLEPSSGRFELGWLEDAINLAADHGIRTILGTPTASIPPWLRKAHPDVLSGDISGRFDYGARKGHCLHHPGLIEAVDRIVEAVAQRFGQHPSVLAWQVDNEPGYPFAMYDPITLRAFRDWLKRKYLTIDRLNEVWGTAFWSHGYQSFDEIEFAIHRPDGATNPGQRLDYRRFFSDSFMHYLRRQAAILRRHVGQRPIFTNWPNMTWSVDTYQSADFLDFSAWDNYNRAPGTHDHREQYVAALNHDMCRCASANGQFILAEQAALVPAHAPVSGMRLQLFHELAHGAAGTIYFEWRPPLRGAEQGFKSCLQVDGSFGPGAQEIARTAHDFQKVASQLVGSRTDSDVAMIYCYENAWEQGFWCGPAGYDAEIARVYAGLRTLGRNVDVVPPGADLSRYRLIAAPGLQIISDETAQQLTAFVASGGTLVIGPETATRDRDNALRPQLAPGPLAELAGLVVSNSASKAAMAGNLLGGKLDQGLGSGYVARFESENESFEPATIMEAVELRGARPIAQFHGGLMEAMPAVCVNRTGAGMVVYVAMTCHNPRFHDRLFQAVQELAKIEPLLPTPVGVEVATRTTDRGTIYFLNNLTTEPMQVPLSAPMMDLLTDRRADLTLELPPLGSAVLREV